MKKAFYALLVLFLLAACGGYDEPEYRYTRITSWDYDVAYSLLLTNVEEFNDTMLLRGVLARPFLTAKEVAAIRTGEPIEINGETFVYLRSLSFLHFMHSERTGEEISLTPMGFGVDYSPLDSLYAMMHRDRLVTVFKRTDLYREVEVDGSTTVITSYQRSESGATDDGGWEATHFFEQLESGIDIFSSLNHYRTPDGFGFSGALNFVFEGGRCTHVYFSRGID